MKTVRQIMAETNALDNVELMKQMMAWPYERKVRHAEEVARCGNAVPPPFATALARANAPEWCAGKKIATMAEWIDHVAV